VSTLPIPNDDLIERAEKALRAFAGEPLNWAQAERLLTMWAHYGELTPGQCRQVLRRFPRRVDVHAWWPQADPEAEGHLWRCTCGHTVFQPFDSAVPDELISHPQSFGQMRGGDWEGGAAVSRMAGDGPGQPE
jgi:hypothetical protein